MQPEFDHIAGLEGRDPVGVVFTVGIKGPKGNPTNTDRFYAVLPQEDENRVRPQHPQFAQFNAAPVEARQVLRGNLVHSDRADAFHHQLRAQVLGKAWAPWPKAHPSRRPVCSGDGERAMRLYGIGEDASEDWREIECPNEKCEFRQGEVKACKPFARLYFRPRWADGSKLPTPLAKLTSQSWNSISAFLGFFEHVEEQARQLGVDSPSLYGLPFVLTLGRKKIPQRERSFPVMTIAPECDLIAFFAAQREQIRLAGGRPVLRLAAGAQSDDENDPDEIDRDVRAITPTPPQKPAHTTGEVGATTTETHTSGFLFDAPPETMADRVRRAARERGIPDETLRSLVGGSLDDAPESAEAEIMAAIERATTGLTLD